MFLIVDYSANSAKSNASHSSYSGGIGGTKSNPHRTSTGYGGNADTSFESAGGSSLRSEDIVRIRVPYNRYVSAELCYNLRNL